MTQGISLGDIITLSTILIAIVGICIRFINLEKSEKARKKENTMILNTLAACIDGLLQLGANGKVTKANEAMEQYLRDNRK